MAAKDKGKKRVAVIGYGSQGRAVALNLRDSGYNVTVGLRQRSKSRQLAQDEGVRRIETVADAVRESEIVCFAFPDHLHHKVFERSIRKNLNEQAGLWFLHGLSVHFGLVTPPAAADVFLVAPHAPGNAVREKYLGDRSVSGFYAVANDASGRAWETARAMAERIGLRRGNLLKTTFEEEAVGDIFGEQAVLCGGLAALIKSGFETLVENGHAPEHAYLEVAHQLDLIVDLIKKHGVEGMFKRISVAARFGSFMAGQRIVDESVKKRMLGQYSEIKSGRFARKLSELSAKDIRALDRALHTLSHPQLEKAARKVRGR
ncbi:MAG: ketol-acid reductoisomerase [Candidatus Zixiibacteriota bacterium]|nr:MAG: ketol-acid reductoisomerase [candidate division Zixibacteria bacterium]